MNGLDTSSWCLLQATEEEQERDREGNDNYVYGDDIVEREEEENGVGGFISEGWHISQRMEGRLEDLFLNQRKILKLICCGFSRRNNKGVKGGGGSSDDAVDDKNKVQGKETRLDLVFKDLTSFHVAIATRRYEDRASFRRLLCDIVFAFDLIGCLRRFVIGSVETEEPHDSTTPLSPSPATHRVCICAAFLHCLGGPCPEKECLQQMLITCIANLSFMEAFHLMAKRTAPTYRMLMPILAPKQQQQKEACRRSSRVRELRLERVSFNTAEEILDFAAGLGQRGRWDFLRRLEIGPRGPPTRREHMLTLDPIFRAVARGNSNEKGKEHLPRLEAFRLIPPDKRSYYEVRYELDDDTALIPLLDKPSIKHLALGGVIQPRHCHLIQSHLSKHRNIETVRISGIDRKGSEWVPGEDETGTQKQEVVRALRCLVQLARDSPNMNRIALDDGGLPEKLKEWMRLGLRELDVWTALNRNGRKHFLACAADKPYSPSSCWTRRDCVDFLARLLGLENFTDVMTVEVLFLSLRMRPDLLV